jgi:hypothetical protein
MRARAIRERLGRHRIRYHIALSPNRSSGAASWSQLVLDQTYGTRCPFIRIHREFGQNLYPAGIHP